MKSPRKDQEFINPSLAISWSKESRQTTEPRFGEERKKKNKLMNRLLGSPTLYLIKNHLVIEAPLHLKTQKNKDNVIERQFRGVVKRSEAKTITNLISETNLFFYRQWLEESFVFY